MSLYDVVAAVAHDFRQNGCPAKVQFGSRFIPEHNEPPRVVFVPSKKPERYGNPLQIQAPGYTRPQTAAYVELMGGANPRPIATRYVSTEVHIWGGTADLVDPIRQEDADQHALDALINQTVLSLYKTAPGNNRTLSGSQIQAPAHVHRGLVYVLEAQIEVPIVDIQWAEIIDACSRTWVMEPDVEVRITAQQIDRDGQVDYTLTFTAGDPESEE